MSTQTTPAPAETTETAPAPAAPRQRYADNAAELAERLAVVTRAGFTRPALMRLTGMGGSAVWRCQHGKAHPGEVETLTAVLDRIESGEIKPEKRAAKASRADELAGRLTQVDELLARALAAKTKKDADKLLGEARVLVAGEAAPAPENAG